MNAHTLPIAEPPIYGYLCNAYPLSIALQHNNSQSWFYSNYIQLICAGNFPEGKFFTFYNSYFEWDHLFLGCPFLQYQKIHYSYIEKYDGKFINFICDTINKNGYIYLYVDEYYIPNKPAYNKYSLPHEILIYGYNRSKNKILVMGYNSDSTFGTHEVGFEELLIGFLQCDKSSRVREFIYILEFNADFQYEFDVELVLQSLKEYRNSSNSSIHFRALCPPNNWWIYGMSAYYSISQYLHINIGETKKKIDIRIFHTIWEHKSVMVQRINYMINQKYINNADDILKAYTLILKQSEITKNLVLKYNFTKNKLILNKILSNLDEIKAAEEIVLDKFIALLENDMISKLACH